MKTVDINDFTIEKECNYEGERFSVRDNGSVFRHQRPGKRARPNDNQWTFGKVNSSNPYLHISDNRIHRIVATAFHGEPLNPQYVVDHIDSNCRNNRPENLRWLTRLENALNNPLTRKKIEYLCGSIEAFLENPSMLNDLQGDPNFAWMRTVSSEEAQNCKARMTLWANSTKKPTPSLGSRNMGTSFTTRVYKPLRKWEVGFGREPGLDLSLTHWCAVYMMLRAPAYFPCCPQEFRDDPIEEYFQNLKPGAVFAHPGKDEFKDICPTLKVFEAVNQKEKSSILVICEREDGKWSIVGIKLDEKTRWFIHYNLGAFDCKTEAQRALIIKKDLKDFWANGYTNAYS